MTKAAMPMTGGMICPPVEALASIAAARCGRYPTRTISGIVTTPTVMMFDTTLPEMVPNSDDPTMAILAGPPRYLPISAIEMSVKYAAPPDLSRTCPNRTKITTTVETILSVTPSTAVESHTE